MNYQKIANGYCSNSLQSKLVWRNKAETEKEKMGSQNLVLKVKTINSPKKKSTGYWSNSCKSKRVRSNQPKKE